jgi:DNA protecting protein DprA
MSVGRMPCAFSSRTREASIEVGPKNAGAIMLSGALLGTGRFPETQQIDFLGGGKDRSDLCIYYAGDLSLLKRPSVAIVGTRDVSEAGIAATEWLTRRLVESGLVIVSGLAYGVDTVAHTTAINHDGKTIAVIGTPLDKATPSENAALQERIYREHLLVSRFAKGEKTFRTSFPLRNRLMAALSDATGRPKPIRKRGRLLSPASTGPHPALARPGMVFRTHKVRRNKRVSFTFCGELTNRPTAFHGNR